jgi:arginine exporter protein ArgO
MMARFGMALYLCGLAIASMCWLAALTILAAIVTNRLPDSEAWIAVVFFAAAGGLSWMAGRAAKHALAGR